MRKNVYSLKSQAKAGLITAWIGVLSVSLPVAGIVTASPYLARENAVSVAQVPTSPTLDIATAMPLTQAFQTSQNDDHAAAGTTSGLLAIVNHDDIKPADRILLNKTFLALPALCRDHIANFYVNYANNAPRGLSGAGGTMAIAGNESPNEMAALATHECGHIVDLAAIRGTLESGLTTYFDGKQPVYSNDPSVGFYSIDWQSTNKKKTGSTDNDFVSGYAKTDIFEDFAESFAFYALHQQEFARLAQHNPALAAKYNWLSKNVFTDHTAIATSNYHRTNLAWDVTKLPYTLN